MMQEKTIPEKIGYITGQVTAISFIVGITIGFSYSIYWLVVHFSKIVAMLLGYGSSVINSIATLDAVIIVAVIGAFATFLVNVWSKSADHRRERQRYLTEKREAAYEDFLALFFDGMEGKDISVEGTARLNQFKQTLMLYGSKRTYNAFKKWWIAITSKTSSTEETMRLMELIISEMRNDVKAGRIKKSIMANIMISSEEDSDAQ